MRTWVEISAFIGVPQGLWTGRPFVAWPIQIFREGSVLDFSVEAGIHPVGLAHQWRTMLAENPSLTPGEIARNQGFTPSRIRQILRLDSLDPTIRDTILEMEPQLARRFGEKRLLCLIPLGRAEQRAKFLEMCARFDSATGAGGSG